MPEPTSEERDGARAGAAPYIAPTMRRTHSLVLLAALTLACGPSVDPDTPLADLTYEEQGVPFVDAGDLRAWMQAGHEDEIVFVDNRDGAAFRQQRIRGARLIPTPEVQSSLGALPVNKWAVFYCT